MSAVCGQTGVQTSCAARAEVTANVGSGDQQDLRLLSHNGVAQNLCVCIGGVGLEQVALANQNLVSAVSAQFLCHLLAYALAAKQQAANFSAHVVCQLACLRDQLEYGRLQLALALLTEYPYAGEIGEVGVIKISIVLFSFQSDNMLLQQFSRQSLTGSLVSALEHLALTSAGE